MNAFYVTLISFNAFCFLAILLSGIRKEQPHFIGLACINILLLSFNLLSLLLLNTTDLQRAILLSKYHLSCLIIGIPLYYYVFGKWSKFRFTRQATIASAIICLPLLAYNLLSSFSLRYGEAPVLVEYVTLFGNLANVLTGQSNAYSAILHVVSSVMGLFLIYCSIKLYRQQLTFVSLSLLLTMLLQVSFGYTGYILDSQQSTFVYFGGLPMTVMSIFTVLNIAYGYSRQSSKLIIEKKHRDELHELFEQLARLSNESGNEDFFIDSTRLLAGYCSADFALLGIIDKADATQITTKVAVKYQETISNFTYARSGTPCEDVLKTGACMYPENVDVLFPDDQMLSDENIKSYVGYPLTNENNQPIGLLVLLFKRTLPKSNNLGIVTDVFATRLSAELRKIQLEEELKATAYIDYLTKLPSRAKLLHVINNVYSKQRVNDTNSLLLLFDIDHFGEINSKFGYDVGDQVLKIIGKRLNSYTSHSVFIARNGGDEFAVLLSDIKESVDAVVKTHWTAIKAIVSSTYLIGSRKISVTCSMGAVLLPHKLDEHFDIIGSAELALTVSKKDGRGHYRFFDPQLMSKLSQNRNIELALIEALNKNKELSVHYQPKVNIDGKLVGAEALVRWTSKELGFVSPADFIPIAEETGIIYQLGDWVLRRVLYDMLSWREKGLVLAPVSINVTASQFDDESFAEVLLDAINSFDIDASLIEIELTESGLLIEKERAIAQLSILRGHGFTVSLDDFGTGYSSLSYLSALPLDVLKIDKSFVDGLDDVKDRELVKTIIAISKSMELSVIAEGTETKHQVETLYNMGCELFQGYYFSKPLPAAELCSWLPKT
ncbi:bifunctional diguanylate cyclase/phosphodiesterase [Alteromonas sp. P256]|uniref:bifunctional diguanylate cyclase/phosphodiesterase n=1 Tax=Alteromonas sp. P256 TaxID=3117399 RepID=UPI002FE1BFD8